MCGWILGATRHIQCGQLLQEPEGPARYCRFFRSSDRSRAAPSDQIGAAGTSDQRSGPPGSTYADHVSRLERITSDPAICHGKPTIRGLRYPVENILELLAGGMSIDEVLADYDDLDREDVLAALEFGALASGLRRVVPLGAA